jgi:hypothetical protein
MHRIIECLKTPVGLKEVHAAIDDQDLLALWTSNAHTPIGICDHTRLPNPFSRWLKRNFRRSDFSEVGASGLVRDARQKPSRIVQSAYHLARCRQCRRIGVLRSFHQRASTHLRRLSYRSMSTARLIFARSPVCGLYQWGWFAARSTRAVIMSPRQQNIELCTG